MIGRGVKRRILSKTADVEPLNGEARLTLEIARARGITVFHLRRTAAIVLALLMPLVLATPVALAARPDSGSRNIQDFAQASFQARA